MIWFEEQLTESTSLKGVYNGQSPSHKHIIEVWLTHRENVYLVYHHDPSSLGYQDPNREDVLGKYVSKINRIKGLIDMRGMDGYLDTLRQ